MVVVKIRKRHLTFLLIFIVVLGLGVVLAVAPNPGHPINQLEPSCTDGQVLKIVGGVWGCGSGSLWTLSGNNIYRDQGYVGIGTNTPTEKLDVYGNVRIASGNRLKFGPEGSGESIVSDQTVYNLIFSTNFLPRMTIANNGNVGIGTNAPWAELSIVNDPPTNTQRDALSIVTEPWGGRSLAIAHKGGGSVIEAYNWVNNDWQSIFTIFNNGDLFVRGKTHLEGNVGIGTSNPAYKLSVNGDIAGNGKVLPGGVGGFFGEYLQTVGGDLVFGAGNAERVIIKNGGNVGIGTSNPSQKLDVAGYVRATRLLDDDNIHFVDSNGESFMQSIRLGNAGGGGGILKFAEAEDDTGIWHYGDGKMSLRTNNVDRVFIDDVGRVGIGTLGPGATLDVAGNIKANAITVNANGATIETGYFRILEVEGIPWSPGLTTVDLWGTKYFLSPNTYWWMGVDGSAKFIIIHKGLNQRPRYRGHWDPS